MTGHAPEGEETFAAFKAMEKVLWGLSWQGDGSRRAGRRNQRRPGN